jgi:hypothetical protein
MGEGRANRISQYKKPTSIHMPPDRSMGSNGKSPQTVGRQENMEMDDDSFGTSPRVRTANSEADMKQAVMNMHETQEVNAVIKEFEKNFSGAKKKINECDLVTLESELTVLALKM